MPTATALQSKDATRVRSGFRRLEILQNVRRGDPLAVPYSSTAGYIPQHVSFANAFSTTEDIATSPHVRALKKLLRARSEHMHTDEITDSDDSGGQIGISINPTSSNGNDGYTQNGDGSVWDAMSYNFEDDIYVAPPTDSYGNYLYAPTTHGPNGNCLESTVDYFDNTQSSGTYFQIADWCVHPGQITYYHVPIDDNFVQNYVEVYNNGDGYPEFQEEVYRDSNSTWHQLLYSNLSNAYQDIYDSTGINYIQSDDDTGADALGYTGWNIFETHFSASTTCPTFSTISASGLRVQTSNDGSNGMNWSYVPSYGLVNTNGDCFNPQMIDFYTYQPNSSDLGWVVTDPPACTIDSSGYCAQTVSTTQTGSCRAGSNVHGVPIYVYADRVVYRVYHQQTLAETATKSESVGTSAPCTLTSSWSPGEPKVQYGDSSLP